VILLAFITMPTSDHGMYPGLPKVLHSATMPGAAREDALRVSIAGDGKVYFGGEQVTPENRAGKIAERLKDPQVEWKLYVVADGGARWGSIKPVLDSVRAAGIARRAFLVDQPRPANLPI